MNKDKPKISIIIPCYNEQDNVKAIYRQVKEVLHERNIMFLFVDDCSTDNTLFEIELLAQSEKDVQYLSFSRNFGHQNALKAGFDYADGDCIICMDADLQHPPVILNTMLEKWEQGNEIVYTIRKDNQNVPFLKKLSSRLFYKILNVFSEVEIKQGTADFRLIDKKTASILKNNLNEYHLFYKGIISWIGFKQTYVEYSPGLRKTGHTKYSFLKMCNFALDGITSFSIKPLKMAVYLGVLLSLISAIYAVYAIAMHLFTNRTVEGWTSLLLSVLFIGGVNMIILGIIGEYIGKIYMQTKNRPHYLIKKSNLNNGE